MGEGKWWDSGGTVMGQGWGSVVGQGCGTVAVTDGTVPVPSSCPSLLPCPRRLPTLSFKSVDTSNVRMPPLPAIAAVPCRSRPACAHTMPQRLHITTVPATSSDASPCALPPSLCRLDPRPIKRSHHGGARTAPALHRHCTVIAPSLHHHCTVTAPSVVLSCFVLNHHCTIIILTAHAAAIHCM